MSDLRATERLLEVIDEALNEIESHLDVPSLAVTVAMADVAIQELRKRGDTLVRADDLRLIVQGKLEILPEPRSGDPWSDIDERSRAYFDAITRLENALGGKLA